MLQFYKVEESKRVGVDDNFDGKFH